jgi:hypothetical protein
MESSDNERGPGWVLYSGCGSAFGGRLLGVRLPQILAVNFSRNFMSLYVVEWRYTPESHES